MATYTCKIFTVSNSKPCETIVRNVKHAIKSSNLVDVVKIEEIDIDDEKIVKEGITRAPVFELWNRKRLVHYHVGVLTHSEILELIIDKVHKEQ